MIDVKAILARAEAVFLDGTWDGYELDRAMIPLQKDIPALCAALLARDAEIARLLGLLADVHMSMIVSRASISASGLASRGNAPRIEACC